MFHIDTHVSSHKGLAKVYLILKYIFTIVNTIMKK